MTTEGQPAVTGSDIVVRDAMVSSLVRRMLSFLYINHLLDETLHSYSTPTLQRLSEAFDGPLNNKLPWGGLRGLICNSVQNGGSEHLVADLLDSIPYVKYYQEKGIKDSINSLFHYRKLGWVPQRTDTNEDPRFGRLIYVTDRIISILVRERDDDLPDPAYVPINVERWGEENSYSVITDKRLIDIIWRHTDKYERVIDLILERDCADPEMLEAIFDSCSPAIREGVL